MKAIDKLCQLCADDLNVSVFLEEFEDLAKIQEVLKIVSKIFVDNKTNQNNSNFWNFRTSTKARIFAQTVSRC